MLSGIEKSGHVKREKMRGRGRLLRRDVGTVLGYGMKRTWLSNLLFFFGCLLSASGSWRGLGKNGGFGAGGE